MVAASTLGARGGRTGDDSRAGTVSARWQVRALIPAPDPRAVLLGLAVLRERGRDVEPCSLGGNLAWHGEPARPFVLVGCLAGQVLQQQPGVTGGPRFPWDRGAAESLARFEQFVTADDDRDACGDDAHGHADHAETGPSGLPGGERSHRVAAAVAGHAPDLSGPEAPRPAPWPFEHGVTVGWIGHELSATRLVRYRGFLFFDGTSKEAWWIARDGDAGICALVREAEQLGVAHAGPTAVVPAVASHGVDDVPAAWIPTSEDAHTRRVQCVQNSIAAGDVYQVNLSHRIEVPLRETGPVALTRTFLDLMSRNPVPFPALVSIGDTAVLALSPERYCARRGDLAESRPIKGTRPRGGRPEEDRRLARELAGSSKDRAENVMIVDLVRNDLGRLAVVGGVSVRGLCEVESFASVHHLVSTVQARLRPDIGLADILAAVHPAGSMTGAPKMRAVEILRALEGRERGVYAGGIGWFAGARCFDLAMVIRSIIVRGDSAQLPVGGGIVADSEPHAEYLETLDKARSLVPVAMALRDAGPTAWPEPPDDPENDSWHGAPQRSPSSRRNSSPAARRAPVSGPSR